MFRPRSSTFLHNCLPNEEQIESPQKFKYLNKMVYEQKIKSTVKIASGKTENKQNKLYFTRKDMGPVHNKAR